MITVVLGNEGIRELQSYLMRQQRLLQEAVFEAEKKIAIKGKEILETIAPTQDIDGNIAGTARIEPRKEGYGVAYVGNDVAYIEFGTGYRGETNPHPNTEALQNADWNYDIHEHGQKGWFYRSKRDGTIHHSKGGIEPQKPVFDSYKKTLEYVKEIVKEVLHEKLGS